MQRASYTTVFGSLDSYEKGGVELIADDARHYAFSNIFEVAATSAPWEKVAVGQNMKYVLEAVRAEGVSPWWTASHDEFAVCFDGEITVDLVHLDEPIAGEDVEGSVRLSGDPVGPRMGRIHLKHGHQALLPAGSAYRFTAERTGVLLMQTIAGSETTFRWADICQTV